MSDTVQAALDAFNEKVKKTALESLGLTVLAVQQFEQGFALVYLGHKTAVKMGKKFTAKFDMGDPDYRTTTTAHIKNLLQAGRIDSKFADRLFIFVNKRHELIHRWTIQSGYPGDAEPAKWIDLMTACAWVVVEITKLFRLLKRHVDRLDDESDADYSTRQAEIFKLAGASEKLTIPSALVTKLPTTGG